MTTDRARGERLEIRRPDDVPAFTALSRLVEQRAGQAAPPGRLVR
ncbi:hypothetical protein [Streptomyces fungicidicus]